MIHIKINISFAKKVGSIHISNNTPCQDYVNGLVSGSNAILALSDGAGSKKYALETAKALVDKSTSLICDEELLYLTSDQIVDIMNDELARMNLPFEDMGSTLLFVAINGNKYMAVHIGDGVIMKTENDAFKVLSEPENGDQKNQTFFLPAISNEQNHLRIYQGEINEDTGFIVASDGISDLLYDNKTKQGMNICKKLNEWNIKYTSEECSQIIKDNLNEVISQYSSDDLSIGVISVLV